MAARQACKGIQHPIPMSEPAEETKDPAIDKMESVSASAARSLAANEAKKANTIACSNTKLVACLHALGFPSDCAPAENVTTRRVVREFMVQPRSVDPTFAHLRIDIARRFETGELQDTEPMHPLCIMMRAQHNYERVKDMHKGAVMNLRSTAFVDPLKPEKGGRMTIYKRGVQPDPVSNFSPEKLPPENNLALVAALGGVGIPVLAFDGEEGRHRYILPRFGYALTRDDGTQFLEDGLPLLALAHCREDPWRLALAERDPLHIVVLGYNAIRSRIYLRELLGLKKPRLHVQDGNLQAMLAGNFTGRVMDQLTERFGVPPI